MSVIMKEEEITRVIEEVFFERTLERLEKEQKIDRGNPGNFGRIG